MAGGVQSQPPPPHELMVFPSIKPSQFKSKPSQSQVFGQLYNLKDRSTIFSEAQPLEDGEISPLLTSCVPSSSGPQPNTLSQPLSYSNIVQGHKDVLPISEVISVDPASLCHDSCSLKPLSLFEGKPCVKFKSSEKKILINNQKFVLVGKFSHGRPPLAAIKIFFAALKLQGRYNLSIFDNKHLFIELDLKIDYVMVWLKLTWTISGYAMRIFKWESDFSPVKKSAIAPVWIRIEGVPLYLFDKMSLLSIANAIGHPLSVHPLNVSRVKLNSAIICVELDVNTIPVDSIYVCFEDDCSLRPVEGFWLKVYYDVLPPYCISCLHIGHLVDDCKKGLSESGAGFSSSVFPDEHNRTATKVFDVMPQRIFPTVSTRSSAITAGTSNNHGRKVKYTQVWRENKDTWVFGSRRHVPNSKGKEVLTENSFGPLELTATDIAAVPAVLVSTENSIVEMRDRGKDLLPSLSVAQDGLIQDRSSTPTIPGEVTVGSFQFVQADGSASECVKGLVEVASVFPAPASATGKEPEVLPAPDSAVKPVKPDFLLSVQLDTVADVAAMPAGANQPLPSFVAEQVALPSSPTDNENEKNQIVSTDGLFVGEVKQQTMREQNACTALIKDRPTTTQPGKTNFSERVAQKELNEGLPLKKKSNANLGSTHQTTKRDNEYAQKKIEQIVLAPFSRRTSHEDSEVDENRPTQDNPQTDLPPEILMAFICPKGTEISMNEYQDAGYRLIARRSLSPTGRSSSKLTSLRKKVENIQICEEKTSVKVLQEYSKEYQEDIVRARRPKITSQGDKLPSPNGPGQSRQRRNRGRNRGYYGTPDRSSRYHVPGAY